MGSELYTNETKIAVIFLDVLIATSRNNILKAMA
jgi:hypothetical protein